MGIKLIILLALVLGVLYCLHLLVRDYQAVTAPRLLRLLFKRDLDHQNQNKPHVRWKKILRADSVQCARLLYCSLGAQAVRGDVQEGLVNMLTLEARAEDAASRDAFQLAVDLGAQGRRTQLDDVCTRHYPRCPLPATALDRLLHFLLEHNPFPT